MTCSRKTTCRNVVEFSVWINQHRDVRECATSSGAPSQPDSSMKDHLSFLCLFCSNVSFEGFRKWMISYRKLRLNVVVLNFCLRVKCSAIVVCCWSVKAVAWIRMKSRTRRLSENLTTSEQRQAKHFGVSSFQASGIRSPRVLSKLELRVSRKLVSVSLKTCWIATEKEVGARMLLLNLISNLSFSELLVTEILLSLCLFLSLSLSLSLSIFLFSSIRSGVSQMKSWYRNQYFDKMGNKKGRCSLWIVVYVRWKLWDRVVDVGCYSYGQASVVFVLYKGWRVCFVQKT